jgi:hypothetical protein
MQPHLEIDTTRAAVIATGERFWGWEIPVYLFLGGLVAGLMLTASVVILAFGKERITRAMKMGLAAAPILLALGMGALFIDLTYKLHTFRFYTAIRFSAPMSLGSWVLLLVFPVQVALILALPMDEIQRLLDRVPRLDGARRFAEQNLRRRVHIHGHHVRQPPPWQCNSYADSRRGARSGRRAWPCETA